MMMMMMMMILHVWIVIKFHIDISEHRNVEPRPTVANLATVAVLPVSDKVPLSTFTLELQHTLNAIGKRHTTHSKRHS